MKKKQAPKAVQEAKPETSEELRKRARQIYLTELGQQMSPLFQMMDGGTAVILTVAPSNIIVPNMPRSTGTLIVFKPDQRINIQAQLQHTNPEGAPNGKAQGQKDKGN